MATVAAFPGSFNPPTIAHLAIAGQVRLQFDVDRVDLVVSRRALAKERIELPLFHHRLAVLDQAVADLDWLAVMVTDAQLLADVARGYDLLIVGADKWWQINETKWYGSATDRDRAIASLPSTVVVPRDGFDTPPHRQLHLDDATLAQVSSSRARRGEPELMVPAARRFADETGAWLNPVAYKRWLASQTPPEGRFSG